MAIIYAVINNCTERLYVGCTASSLNRRLNEHRYLLRKRKHSAVAMQADFDAHGGESFAIHVLERLPTGCDVSVKREAELRWMRHYEKLGVLYNEQLISFGPGAGYRQKAHTPEANMKRRLSQLGKPKRHGHKISAAKKALGQKPSREAIIKGNKAMQNVRYGKTYEIVSSASKKEDAGS